MSSPGRSIRAGCISAIVGLVVIVASGALYLSMNPLFSLPETGHLSSASTWTVRLDQNRPVAAHQLEIRHDPRIFSDSRSASAVFDPTRLTVTASTEGGGSPVSIRIYPAAPEPITDLSGTSDDGVTWSLDCEAIGRGACRQTVLVVVVADEPAAALDVTVRAEAELAFPAHVPTPLLVSIGLDARETTIPATGAALHIVEASASSSVSPEDAVSVHDLDVPETRDVVITQSGAPLAGAHLELTVTRNGDATPVGLSAPPPVRAAVTDETGTVVIDQAVRPGKPTIASLPPLEGRYQLVVWWQDRAADAYDVEWRLEQGIVTYAIPGAIVVTEAPDPPSVVGGETSGEATVTTERGEAVLEFGSPIEMGSSGPGRLPIAAGVVRISLEAEASDSDAPLVLLLSTEPYSYSEQVPVVIVPGERVDLAIDAMADCGGARCQPWIGQLAMSDPSATQDQPRSVDLSYSLEWQAWRLDEEASSPLFDDPMP